MTKWADKEYGPDSGPKLLHRFAITGDGPEWGHLQHKIFALIDNIVDRLDDVDGLDHNTLQEAGDVMKDLTSLAAKWARAKVERSSLENDKIRSAIALDFAEATKRYAEARRSNAGTIRDYAEADKLRSEALVAKMDALERMLNIVNMIAHSQFRMVGNDGHLLIGPRPQQLGEPDGDPASIASDPITEIEDGA